MKHAVLVAVILCSVAFLACSSDSELRGQPAELRFGILWRAGEPLEGRSGPYSKLSAEIGGPAEIYLGSDTLTARPARVHKSSDHSGFPAVTLGLVPEDAATFEAFTGRNVDRAMAILVEGVVVSVSIMNEPLPGSVQLSDPFTAAQADELIADLTR